MRKPCIPFWLEILDLSRPRNQFAGKRRIMALAARRDEPAAYDALRVAARHAHPQVRALAVHYLGRAYLDVERSIPEEALADLAAIAVQDAAFGSRFQARSVLRRAGQPVPLDNPGGVYALKVKFMWAKRIYRTIELRSEQTLDDLHFAIQRAIHWDADHLYSFYLNGQRYDDRYAFACPYEEDRPPWTDEAVIGELGLMLKQVPVLFRLRGLPRIRGRSGRHPAAGRSREIPACGGQPGRSAAAVWQVVRYDQFRAAGKDLGKRVIQGQLIEDLTLLLLYLTFWEEQPFDNFTIRRAWKGFRFEALNALEEAGYIDQGRRAKSVMLTQAGIERARALVAQYPGDAAEGKDER